MNERTLELYNELIKIVTPDTVFACVGAVKTTSYLDSIGPQIGDILKANGIPFIYGTHDKPYNGITSEHMAQVIKRKHKNNTVIAIDTCCTVDTNKLYKIKIESGSIAPGAGINKNLPRIGNYCIKAFMLLSTEKNLILNKNLYRSKKRKFLINQTNEMVEIISTAIINAYKDACKKQLLDLVELNTNEVKVSKLL